ncbi:MAG: serine/threonine protein kinase, partial [Umezawaea sp.]
QPSYQQQARPAAAPHRTAPPRQSSTSVKDAAGKRSTIITALAIVAAAVVGIMLASFLSSGDEPNDKVAGPGSSASVTPPPGESGKDDAPPAGDGSKLPPQVTGDPDQATQEKMIRDYFALLPGDPNSAFNWLTDKMKSASKGKATYLDFWKTIKTVKIDSVKLNSAYAYEVDVAYTSKDGTTSKERKLIALEWSGNQLLIDKESPLGNY